MVEADKYLTLKTNRCKNIKLFKKNELLTLLNKNPNNSLPNNNKKQIQGNMKCLQNIYNHTIN